MLGHQLRQRCFQVAFCPGTVQLGPARLNNQASRLAFSTDGDNPQRQPPATPSSTPVSPPGDAAASAGGVGPGTKEGDGSGEAVPQKASGQPSKDTAAAMATLRSRLAASHVAADKRPDLSASSRTPQPSPATPPKPTAQPGSVPKRHQEIADFQGFPLHLGETGNPLQSMAVLTHGDVRQLEEYGKDPQAADRRFLASLQKMARAPQQRAAAIMQMAAGAVPPPAVLVWAAQEVVRQLQLLLRERLALAQQRGTTEHRQQDVKTPMGTQGSEGSATSLTAEPWYEGAVQLAKLTLGSAAGQQPTSVRTELELLHGFATATAQPTATATLPEQEQQVPQPAGPYVASWEDLLALPQLQRLLDAATARRPELASVLELAGLRSTGGAISPQAPQSAASAAATLDQAPSSGSGGKGKQRQKAQVLQTVAATASSADAWLLPALRSAAAAARIKALQVTGLGGPAAGEVPLDANVALTALALGTPRAEGSATALPPAEHRVAAANWLAAATLLRHAEERLGCAGGGSGVWQEAVPALHLLGLPLEPWELSFMRELQVSEQELQTWLSQLSVTLATSSARSDGSALPIPPGLESRLASARQRLAAAGRALVLVAPEPVTGGPTSTAAEAAATQSWLRAVGAPLVSGLLSGGYGSLMRLRKMVPELREAFILRLLEIGRLQGGTAALAAALYSDADAAWQAAHADGAGVATAVALLQREAVAAELDLVHERYVATPTAPLHPRPLPSDAALVAAVQALPPPARLLYDSYYVLRADAGDDATVLQERRRVADALVGAGEGAVLQGVSNLQGWLAEARKGLLVLPPPLLALLLRFLRVQVSVTPEEAQAQRNKLTALAILAAEQQQRAVAAIAGDGGTGENDDGHGAVATAEVAARELAEWSRSGGVAETSRAMGRVPAALAALLGPASAADFTSWLQALALSANTSTHRMLALKHMEMDVERYLTMTHDPRLHLPTSGLSRSDSSSSSSSSTASCPPTSANWTDPALRRSEVAFLEDMRPKLDAYLQALGHRPLGEAEWSVYRDAALQEWEAGREAREQRLAAAGQSGFFNPRADEVYLQQMLAEGIPIGDPLGAQSRRYLETLLRNPSWSFAQRLQAVQRLIQLNAHFASQPPAPEGGSPFAPLFAVGGPDVVPRLEPLSEGGAAAGRDAAARQRNLGRRAGEGAKPLQLPKGF